MYVKYIHSFAYSHMHTSVDTCLSSWQCHGAKCLFYKKKPFSRAPSKISQQKWSGVLRLSSQWKGGGGGGGLAPIG